MYILEHKPFFFPIVVLVVKDVSSVCPLGGVRGAICNGNHPTPGRDMVPH